MMSAQHEPSWVSGPGQDSFYRVDLATLGVGSYNRALSEAHVDVLVRAYRDRPWMLPTIECNMREDGSMVVVNGQHRAEAARRIGLTAIEAVVHFGWTIDQEARSFRDSARGKLVDQLSLWHAARTAGEPQTLAIDAIVAELGLSIPRRLSGTRAPNTVSCTGALMTIAYGSFQGGNTKGRVLRPERVRDALLFAMAAWPEDEHRFDNRILKAVSGWLVKYSEAPVFNRKEAIRKLGSYDCLELIRRIATMVHTEGVNQHVAGVRLLTGLYDNGRRVGRLVPNNQEEAE